ncbi:MAG: hypothetical protein HGA45_14700 [Chloroflexales bacterium]|nr:hypothetical protein [Chloroflexales bacterium]
MPAHEAVNIEIAIRWSGDAYAGDVQLDQPGSQTDAVLATDVRIDLNIESLLAHTLDAAAYGRDLTAQLFAEGSMLTAAWRTARGLADGAALPLRLRLRLAPAAGVLHAVRWETLCDPLTDMPLALDARLRLVRYLDSPNTRPITFGPKPTLRALLVVAAPHDLARYRMADIDVSGEVRRVRESLGAIALTVVGDVDGARSRRATLDAIQDALRAGVKPVTKIHVLA